MDIYQTKLCRKCGILKPISDYNKHRTRCDGVQPHCKSCNKDYRTNNKDKLVLYTKEYQKENKQRLDEYRKEYREKNKDKIKEYRENNKEHIAEIKSTNQKRNRSTINERRRNKYKNDIVYAIGTNIRNLITQSFRRNGYTKKSKTYDILGCSFEELKIHLEKQFVEGMNWDNRSEWHIDHIIPLSSAITEEEIIKLNHYTNLQPLWAIDNLTKGNRLL